MFAVLFDLEGQFDCTLHATETEAKAEAARLSEKYAAERANYSASVAVQAVRLPAPYAAAPAMLAAPQRIASDSSAWGECVNIAADAITAATGGTPTASASICPHCGRDNTGYEGHPCSDDCPQYWEARGIEHPEHPTAEPAAPIGEAVRGLLFDVRDFLQGFEDCEDNCELVQALQARIARATEGEG